MKPLVSVDWLSKNAQTPNVIILDASLESNASNLEVPFPDIQIKNARFFDIKGCFSNSRSNIPNMMPSAETFTLECQKLGINKESIIIVYDNLGVYASPRAWWMFTIMGHKNVAVLDGGLPAWKRKNFACESRKTHPISLGDFEAHYQPTYITKAKQILKNLKTKEAIVIDARSQKRFEATIPESRKNLKSGHIPKSLNLPYLEILNQGFFLSEKQLLQKFKDLQITNKPLIFTCGSGITACVLLLASKLVLKNEVSLYDGSWAEWGKFDNSLIEK